MKVVAYGIGALLIASGAVNLITDGIDGEPYGIIASTVLVLVGATVICLARPKNSVPHRIGRVLLYTLVAIMVVGLIFGAIQMLFS